MTTKTKLTILILVLFSFFIFSDFSGGINSVGNSGCAACHFGGGGGGGAVMLTPQTDCIPVGETISMTICVTDANAVLGGFAINASAGSFTPGTGTRNGNGTNWLTHSSAQGFSSASACWTFDYTAPSTPGSIDFDFYGNAANGNGSNGAGDDTYNGTLSLEVKTALPISMSSFEVKNIRNKQVNIDWSTDSETNNEYFIVERSLDGRIFEGLVDIEGQGNSTTRHDYSFVDEKPVFNQTMYYRIQQVDFDGRAAFSEIKTIELSVVDIQIEKLYPSPLTLGQPLNLSYTLPFETNVVIDVLSSNGQLIQQIKLDGQKGLNERSLDLNGITQKGLYYLVLGNEQTKIEARPIIIQ